MVAMASGQKFVERSRTVHGRVPIMWQIELTDQVTWCSTADADQPGPEERGERAPPGPAEQSAERGGCGQAQRGPDAGTGG